MNRRHVLERLSVVAGVSLAGCSSVLGPGGSGTVLGTIEVVNFSLVPNRIHLTVERRDETLLERTIGLTAIDASDSGAWRIIAPVWSETPAQYTVRALHVSDSGERESTPWEYTFTRDDYDRYYGDSHEDPGCIGALVKIGRLAEDENAAIGIGPTYVENPCSTSEGR